MADMEPLDLVFALLGLRFGLVQSSVAMAPIPCCPQTPEGVIIQRSQLLDSERRLDSQETGFSETAYLIGRGTKAI